MAAICLWTGGCGEPNATVEGRRPENVSAQPSGDSGSASHVDHSSSSDSTIDPTASTVSGLSTKIKFKTDSGATAFSIKPQDDGGKLVDGSENELARFNVDGDKMKIKDPADVVIGYIVHSDGQYKIKDADQVERWKFQRQQDGDWKLKDASDSLINKIKKRDYGYEIEDDNEKSLFKVKLKGDKTSLRDSSEKTVYSTHNSVPSVAVVALGLEEVDRLAVRAALLTMLVIKDAK